MFGHLYSPILANSCPSLPEAAFTQLAGTAPMKRLASCSRKMEVSAL